MSYVDKNLMTAEHVVYRTKRHWIIFAQPLFFLLLGLSFLLVLATRSSDETASPGVAWILAGAAVICWMIALWTGIPSLIDWFTSEFGVTNRRVIVKVGWIRRRALETLLMKVEGIQVEQSIWGRVLNYGTITITGTGGSREPFDRIAAPLEFRRKVQEQTVATQGSR